MSLTFLVESKQSRKLKLILYSTSFKKLPPVLMSASAISNMMYAERISELGFCGKKNGKNYEDYVLIVTITVLHHIKS